MTLLPAELRRQKSIDEFDSYSQTNGPASHAEDIHVVMFDTLMGRVMLDNQSRTNAWYLVRANRGADSAATHRHTAFDCAGRYGSRERNHEIGIIVCRIQTVRAEFHQLVTRLSKMIRQLLLQLITAVIGRDPYSHVLISRSGGFQYFFPGR